MKKHIDTVLELSTLKAIKADGLDVVHVQVRTWRDRVNGNTYNSFELAVLPTDGRRWMNLAIGGCEYGGKNLAEQRANKILKKLGCSLPSERLIVSSTVVIKRDMFKAEVLPEHDVIDFDLFDEVAHG